METVVYIPQSPFSLDESGEVIDWNCGCCLVIVDDLCSPICRLVDGGSGRGFGTENMRDVLNNAPPGDTARPPIAWFVVLTGSMPSYRVAWTEVSSVAELLQMDTVEPAMSRSHAYGWAPVVPSSVGNPN